ncbi:hypothetical protein [Embleya scabrispora]|uniref:hypothetical protein n=1 Tax=Embleya scabrispora TaxID=159449 RepID=UPI0003A56BFE|nr:hypothetical protein [Embleya scabrispora]MYS83732.1 hypothetical protein [Streptomyces sp. SID5474]
MSTVNTMIRLTPVKPATVRRALTRIDTKTVRTHPDGVRPGAPGISVRTLATLQRRRLVRLGAEVPLRGRNMGITRAGRQALIARGAHRKGAWARLLREELTWTTAGGEVLEIADMHPYHCANAAAWLQRNASAIRADAEPRRRGDAVAWIDRTPLMRALVAAVEGALP